MEHDTIAAIATAWGESGIAVIRVSGSDAIAYVDQLYRGKEVLSKVDSHTVHYGKIHHPRTGKLIDEVLVTVMKAPRTFTREDTVEISCHGGLIPVEEAMKALLTMGVRLAEPGEFTKRAFLNGRIDLSQAEAVIDLIRAKTDQAAQVALNQAEGRLSRLIRQLRTEIVETLAHLAVNVDYPEYDAEMMTSDFLQERMSEIHQRIEGLLQTAKQGKIIREGISTAIVGRPNVGKSSLLNVLTQENRAIVTDIPGTTRDVVEEYVKVRGIALRLLDTAGIRETEDVVEKIGVERSKKALETADLILLVLNASEPLHTEDRRLLTWLQGKTGIIIVNKTDLPQQVEWDELKLLASDLPLITTSLVQEQGVEELEQAIADLFFSGRVVDQDATYLSNARHIALLEQALSNLDEGMKGIEVGIPIDMIEIDLKNAWQALGEVIGEAVAEDLIDQIFSQFCLGK
ncbi:tRNA modification GTPase trmE [Seinonella peptonophila]|uniref:tRNA modification GTPase MnmE n=1 Tax=Seinonella peptonophila TaxID=112248 RepID=A0A1M4WZ84_9BACL|nr:tRNA uridine-5-carboxymethylaminomethyl(34) synthesis GTPase MnmE [Seinonella peptonophila]SHE86447.1 tRNA modification GTPase trmE [Seinonella peptonophila]